MADHEAWRELAETYMSLQMYNQAAFCYEELISSQPTVPIYHEDYADVSGQMCAFRTRWARVLTPEAAFYLGRCGKSELLHRVVSFAWRASRFDCLKIITRIRPNKPGRCPPCIIIKANSLAHPCRNMFFWHLLL